MEMKTVDVTMDDSSLPKGDILVVDDAPANVNLLLTMLKEYNYRVRVATNGKRALSSINLSLPDLIMLDINMPDMNGFEVCKKIKESETTRSIPVIFISALDEVIDKVKAFQMGGADYVTKPFQIEEVLVRIENQLKIARLQKKLEEKNNILQVQNRELERINQELILSKESLVKSYEANEKIFSTLANVLPGMVLDEKYRIDAQIGQGGFGIVYRATHLGLNQAVALKVLLPRFGTLSKEIIKRFVREGRSITRINHPNIVAVRDSSVSASGIPYLIMELLQGHTLSTELKYTTRYEVEKCLKLIIPLCEGLAEAHKAGVIHRDIKPDNIFLHMEKGVVIAKLVDFGIAKTLSDATNETEHTVTKQGKIVGTPIYMAPERLMDLPYDGKVDVYSLGMIVYQMLTGQEPFQIDKSSFWTIVHSQVSLNAKPLREIAPELPADLDEIILQTLAKDPHQRPSAQELAQKLKTVSY